MSWRDSGNFPCCHIGCNREADFVIGTNFEDYVHMCIEHKDEYVNENDEVIPVIRKVESTRRDTRYENN
ncbi:hypothetical protein GRF59_14390 [Paenibacillus sp. HJL G12]|uniref:Uncharacterized protein n=1 Tax=Paenibacillus dendrobii TaxID=2691084 RepID=A0A7X3IK34_9BACL|nr:hypothetical protein [Paenibacillus dendrobii]MWV44806.1 hypothetical protein [Paenibacillus dendrobii]